MGREIIYLGAAGSGTPIWDVLAPEGEREEAAEHIYSPRLINFFSIRQVVPKWCQWDLLGLGFAPGLVGLRFSWKKMCIVVNTVYLHTFYYFFNFWAGENGWMA